jgi:predicted ATP-dependent endonuclease of OLD family
LHSKQLRTPQKKEDRRGSLDLGSEESLMQIQSTKISINKVKTKFIEKKRFKLSLFGSGSAFLALDLALELQRSLEAISWPLQLL